MLFQIDELVIVDNLAGRTYLVVYADPSQAEAFALARRRLKELREKLRTPVVIPYAYASMQTESRRDFDKKDYIDAVLKAKEYIAAGDLMQVQIGQVIARSEEHTSELQSLMRISYDVFCLKKKKKQIKHDRQTIT